MLIVGMRPFESFSHAVSIMHRFDRFACFRCNRTLFSIVIPQRDPLPRSIVSFEAMPQFFHRYSCSLDHYIIFSIDVFYGLMQHHQRQGYGGLFLQIIEFTSHLVLEFHSPALPYVSQNLLPASQPTHFEIVNRADYGAFVTFDLLQFKRVVEALNNSRDLVPFGFTRLQLKFYLEDREIVLGTQRNECIIGGIEVGGEIQGAITFNPWEFYCNFTSNRVWLFKSHRCNGMTLVAPMGLHHNISAHFPYSFHRRV